jgi:hypothetical protein
MPKKHPKFVDFRITKDIHLEGNINMIVRGQCILVFKALEACHFNIYDSSRKHKLKIKFTHNAVKMTYKLIDEYMDSTDLIDKNNNSGIINDENVYYWFSIDSYNQRLYAGIGEARIDTAIYQYEFLIKSKQRREFFNSLELIEMSEGVRPIRLVRDPITTTVPLLIKDINELSMNDVSNGTILSSASLSPVIRKMYNYISGKKFVLNDADFPSFSKAIEHSIITPGLWCNMKLKEKIMATTKDKTSSLKSYLRISMGQYNGDTPNIPYIMEIWPIGHYSAVHNHSGASAIIRVLHGKLKIRLFPYLSVTARAFNSVDFNTNDITWISPVLNQTHQVINHKNNKSACITIQGYMYDVEDNGYYNNIEYIDTDGKVIDYEPESDMDFVKFKALMKQEWEATQSRRLLCLCK